MNEQEFVARKFSEYYSRHRISESNAEKREFGFGSWDKKIESRHMRFSSSNELSAALAKSAPFYVSRSAAYYEFPDARPMPRKNWLGADLIFDLDASHKEHDPEGKDCGKFTCEKCLSYIKGQTIKLVEDFLVPDFGFSRSEISVNFSGNRGYHVHVVDKGILPLGREERREMVDYITGTGLQYERFFYKDGRKNVGPAPSDGGYHGKFAREIIRLLRSDEGFAGSLNRKLRKPEMLERFIEGVGEGNWDRVNIADREQKFKEIFRRLSVKLSDTVDVNVTCDVSKLIRLPNSLHGGTGFAAIGVRDLEKFEPMRDAVVLGDGEVKVKITEHVPGLAMKGKAYGPFKKDDEPSVPEHVAIYLICKRAAALA
jgi:DNA primase small subunit